MSSFTKLSALLLLSLLSISSAADVTVKPDCGTCSQPAPKKPAPKKPKAPTLPVPLPPVGVPKLPELPPVGVPKLPELPPVGVPKLPVPLPPVEVPKLPVPLPPVEVPKLPVPLPPVAVPKLPVPLPPVAVPKLPVPLPPVPKLPLLPPVGGPAPKKGCPPPAGGGKEATCPIDTLKLGACVDLLGGLVHVVLGDPAVNECCPIISGLAEVEAAACLCTTLKIKALNLKIFVPLALELLVTCGKTPPPGYTCSL